MTSESGTAKASGTEQAKSSWEAALGKLREWDPAWAEQCVKMTTNPWTEGVLPAKFIELVSIGLNSARTNLNPARATPHPCRYRSRCKPRREFVRTEGCVSNVDSFLYVWRPNSTRGSECR